MSSTSQALFHWAFGFAMFILVIWTYQKHRGWMKNLFTHWKWIRKTPNLNLANQGLKGGNSFPSIYIQYYHNHTWTWHSSVFWGTSGLLLEPPLPPATEIKVTHLCADASANSPVTHQPQPGWTASRPCRVNGAHWECGHPRCGAWKCFLGYC